MWTRYDLKMNAKRAFTRNYWVCVAASLIIAVMSGGMFSGLGGFVQSGVEVQYNDPSAYDTYSAYSYNSSGYVNPGAALLTTAMLGIFLFLIFVALLYGFLVGNVIMVGGCRYYMENREHQTKASQVFYAFQNGRYGNVVKTMLLRDLYVILWALLLIIPGVMKMYSYRLVPYILAENPHMDARRALKLSEQMMRGHRLESFILEISFLGWAILSGFTCGILNIFFLAPYIDATFAEYYTAIRTEGIQKGLVMGGELPGFGFNTM